jgi:hypothetical protein
MLWPVETTDSKSSMSASYLDSVLAVNKEKLGGGAVQAMEWYFRCLDQVTAGT